MRFDFNDLECAICCGGPNCKSLRKPSNIFRCFRRPQPGSRTVITSHSRYHVRHGPERALVRSARLASVCEMSHGAPASRAVILCVASSGIRCKPASVSGDAYRDRTRHPRTSNNNSGTAHENRDNANPSRCPKSRCSNEGRRANLSPKGPANGAHRLQGIGNTQIVRPAGSPRLPHVDGCDRLPCSPDHQFPGGAATSLSSVSLLLRSTYRQQMSEPANK